MSYYRNKIFSSFIWKLLERFSVQGISFLVSICLARLLQPSEYGEIALIMIFINLANVIIDGGFNTALIQKKEVDEVDFSTIFIVTMGTSFMLYALLFLTSTTIASFFGNPAFGNVVKVIGLCLFAYAFNSIQRAYISRHLLFKELFLSSLISTIVSGVIGIALAYNGFGIWALVYHYIASSYTLAIVMLITVKWKPAFLFSMNSFRKLFDYGWKIFLSNFLITLFLNIRGLIIGMFYKPAYLAYFERGRQMPALIMDNINSSIQAVLFPVFSAEQKNLQQIKSMLRRSIRTSSIVLFPLLIGVFAVAKPLVIVLLTGKWLLAVPFIQIFCVAYLMMPLQIASLEALKAIGKSGMFLRLEILKKILEIIILVVSVYINVYAIAIGVIVYNFICIFINTYTNKKFIDYTLQQLWHDVYPPLLAAIAMGAIVYAIGVLPWNVYVILLLQLSAGMVSYITICILFKLESFRYLKQTLMSARHIKSKES